MNIYKIYRKWAMPNSKTFRIKPIKEIIKKYIKETDVVIDPFANEHSIENEIKCKQYISNDIDTDFNTNYHLEAQDFMKMFNDRSVDVVLYDPPYSNRQISECYKKLNKTVTMKDTNSSYFTKFKQEIARILCPGGICISCGWNSNGLGEKYGFEKLEILVVAHGAMHHDTLVVVERRIYENIN